MTAPTDARTDTRPWGSYTVLDEGAGFKVKRIEVAPGKRLSLQRHAHRAEHWTVVAGAAEVTLGDQTHAVATGGSIQVEVGQWHRAANTGEQPLVFIEVQRGDYLGEDDIERSEDDYGRAGAQSPGASDQVGRPVARDQ